MIYGNSNIKFITNICYVIDEINVLYLSAEVMNYCNDKIQYSIMSLW